MNLSKKPIASRLTSFRLLVLLLVSSLMLSCTLISTPQTAEKMQPQLLKINQGFINPLGFYDATPNFSWQLAQSQPNTAQRQYQIVAASDLSLLPHQPDLWNSDIVTSNQTTFVAYQGKPLASRQKVYWQVRYWNQDGQVSSWSEAAHFELGLLSNQDWQAQWIEINSTRPIGLNKFKTPIHIPQHLRREFSADKVISHARLYITAKGIFEAFINGQRVGNDVLTPGYTPYQKRIETLAYDVTELIQQGQNAIGVQLAEGWYAGRFGPERHWHKKLTITPKLLAQLEITFADGSKKIVATDKQWQATQNGPVRTAGLYDGERYDANFELIDQQMKNWNQPGYNPVDWQGVNVSELDPNVLLQPKRHFTSKNKQQLAPRSITKLGNNYIFDLGQNMVGVTRVKVPMVKGQTLQLRFGEGLNADGSLYTKNLGSAAQEDFYTAKKSGIVEWQPQFTFHGFRYVEISGFDAQFTPKTDWVSGIVQYTDFDLAGSLKTSSPALNQLQSNIEWGLKGNFLDVPTDCPQRSERLGWTGDALAFANTSLFIGDTHAFWAAWMQSLREEQFANHGIPVVVPNEVGEIVQAGWSDAAVTIPWDVYWRTGDKEILAENYSMMTRWIQYHQSQLKDGISHMWTVGDWLQPYSTMPDTRRGETDNQLISTAFYARSLDLVARTAKVLGKDKDALHYEQLLAETKHKFQQHFFDQQGQLGVGKPTQTAYLLALGFDLLDETTTQKVIPHLLAQFDAANGHLRTGFLGTPLLAPVLDKIGRADLALDLVFKDTYPSWLYSVSQGATTMWERWDGFTQDNGYADRAGSLNHYAYGAIGEWLYARLAGISPSAAGYSTIRIAPLVTTQLAFVDASYESPHGFIRSKWQREDERLIMELSIPANTRAQVEIPTQVHQAHKSFNGSGTESLGKNIYLNKKLITHSLDKLNRITLESGQYTIEVRKH